MEEKELEKFLEEVLPKKKEIATGKEEELMNLIDGGEGWKDRVIGFNQCRREVIYNIKKYGKRTDV